MNISSEKELSDFILARLGHNSGKMSESIKKFVEDNKISIMNAADNMHLILTSAGDAQ
jgi:hypothetical protein